MAFPIDPLTTAGVFPQGQTSGWVLTFSDEFATVTPGGKGTGLDTAKWTDYIWYDTQSGNHTEVNYDVNTGGNSLCRIWPPTAVFKPASQFLNPDRCLTTSGKFTQQYGFFEARCKPNIGNFIWPAWWLFNNIGTIRYECDLLEMWSGGTNGGFWAVDQSGTQGGGIPVPVRNQFTQWTEAASQTAINQLRVFNNNIPYSNAFHTYAVKWTPTQMTWYLDGIQQGSTFNVTTTQPMYLILQLSIGGESDQNGPITATNPPRGPTNSFEIDYVRVWAAGSATTIGITAAGSTGGVGTVSGSGAAVSSMSWQSETHAGSPGAATLTLDVPAGTADGDLLLTVIDTNGGSVITTLAGWTLIRATTSGGTATDSQTSTFWRKAASEPANYTWSLIAAQVSGYTWRIVGANTNVPVNASSGNSGVGVTATALSVTTTIPNTLLCYIGGGMIFGNASVWTLPASMMQRNLVNTSGDAVCVGGSTIQTALGATGNSVATIDALTTDKWTTQLIAIAPALNVTGVTGTTGAGNLFEINSHVLAGAVGATGSVGTLFVGATLAATVTLAPADGAVISGVVNFAISGTGMLNAELIPPTGYLPIYGTFTMAGTTSATLAFDTTTLPNGTFGCRISAYNRVQGDISGSEVVAMLARTYTINNVYSAALSAAGSVGGVGTVYFPASIVQGITASGATGGVGNIYEINSHILAAAGPATGSVGDIYEINSHILAAAGPATGAVGSLTEINSEAVTASGATGAVGSVIAIAGGIVAISASGGTSAIGSVTEVNSHALTAAGATGAVGTVVNIIGGIAVLSAASGTGAVGTVVAALAFGVAGNETSSATGSVGVILARALTAAAAASSVGNAVMGNALAGNQGSTDIGDVGVRIGQDISALTSKGFIGVPTYKTVYGATVAGVSSAGVTGAPSISGKGNVTLVGVTSHAVIGDDDVNTWSTITAGSNGTWRPVITR